MLKPFRSIDAACCECEYNSLSGSSRLQRLDFNKNLGLLPINCQQCPNLRTFSNRKVGKKFLEKKGDKTQV